MTRRDRIIFLAGLLMLCTACGASKKEVERARKSVYDTDFANVYNAALNVTRELYPMLKDSPGPGRISTAWHQVTYGNNQDDLQNQRTLAQSQGLATSNNVGTTQNQQGAAMTGMPTRLAYKRFFIRFDVSVLGGRPWRVKVVGHASEWDPGAALPTEMNGAQRPAWLDGRTDALTLAIYKRIKQYAIPAKEEVVVNVEDTLPKTDPNAFKSVPAAASKALAAIKDIVAKRDYMALRPQLDENVVWSLGGGTGADVAIATWQADPGILESMHAAINAGCVGDDLRVTCPPGEPQVGVYQLVLENKGGWKITSFVRAD